MPSSSSFSTSIGLASLLSLFFTSSQAQSVSLPSNVAVDLVFPRNDTYNPADTFPVVFALQGASAAWTFGFFFEWRIWRAQGCEGECGIVDTGRLSVDQGKFGGVVGVQANLDGCPSLSATEVETDPCVVEVPEDVISNVDTQMTAGGSPEQPGAPPIPGVPLPGGPPGATTVIGYPSDDGGTSTTSSESSATAGTSAGTSPTPVVPTTGSSSSTPSEIRSSASASRQTSAVPTTVVVNESATNNEGLCQVALVLVLSALGIYML